MKLTYSGTSEEFPPRQKAKLDARLTRISKTLEHGREREARVIVTAQRHLQRVEITLNAFDHALVGEGADRDLFTALIEAVDNLEKQVRKMRARWRTTKRHKEAPKREAEPAPAVAEKTQAVAAARKANGAVRKAAKKLAAARLPGAPEVFRVNSHKSRKPMTLEEAMLEIGEGDNCLVFRDADTERVSVLVRRGDGDFDLVESE